jgi:two-component system chemotaxis sensor kinase CheA
VAARTAILTMDLSRYADLFLTESREHLSAMNHLLLALERAPRATEPVAELFRAVHTVKGMSATMGYGAVTTLAHEMESLLDRVRQGEREVSADMMELLFQGADALERAIARAVAGEPDPAESVTVAAALRDFAAAAPARKAARRSKAAPKAPRVRAPAPRAKRPDVRGTLLKVRLKEGVVLKGARAFLVVKRAEAVGEVLAVEPSVEALQKEEFDRDFGIRISAKSSADKVAEVLRASGDVESVTIEGAPAAPAMTAVAAPVPDAPAAPTRHVRIDLRRLDALMNLVGELVIARGQLQQLAGTSADPALEETVAQGARLIGEMQDEIMRCRMVPVAQVFDRFPRLVRDAARDAGKQVEFVAEGQESELDRSMLDEIGDPVMHLLRNAIDHGIETPADRIAAGKPATGRVTLSISRERSAVTIRVSDDGRGVDRDRVMTKARSLGGALEIRTVSGKGTTVTARLPLTLAIVRAMLARVADETYAVPMTHVTETVELSTAQVRTVQGREALLLRDDVLPLVRLREKVTLGASSAPMQQVVVMEVGERRAALVVDELAGQQDIVVKQFDPVRGGLPLFSGATILADGAPALILDVGSLL